MLNDKPGTRSSSCLRKSSGVLIGRRNLTTAATTNHLRDDIDSQTDKLYRSMKLIVTKLQGASFTAG